MVFAGEDDAAEAAGLKGARYLIGIEIGRLEHALLLVAITPLLVGECVHGEMQKAVELQLLQLDLPLGRHGAVWLWGCSGGAQQ